MLIGAVNSENDEVNKVKNYVTGEYGGVPEVGLFRLFFVKRLGQFLLFVPTVI